MKLKQCARCKEEKPEDQFYKYGPKSKAAGVMTSRCKPCHQDWIDKRNNGHGCPSRELYNWSDDHGYQVPDGVPLSIRRGPWPFCGHCRVRRAEPANDMKAENQTSQYKRYGKRPNRGGEPEIRGGVPICYECMQGEDHGPKTALEWVATKAQVSTCGDTTYAEQGSLGIDRKEWSKKISAACKRNNWAELGWVDHNIGFQVAQDVATARELEQ